MDLTKWKSVLLPIDVYKQIKEAARVEGRTISGQLRMAWDFYQEKKNS